MEKTKTIIIIAGVFILLLSLGNMPGNAQAQTKTTQTTKNTTQAKPKSSQTSKSAQTKPKTTSKSTTSEPVKKKDPGTITIGTQTWAVANLNVSTFRNGDSIPEARTNTEWVTAGESGKPAWCYYNNDTTNSTKYGKLYNWFALNDPRGLAPAGWTLSDDADWAELTNYLKGQKVAGNKMKSTSGWSEGYKGTNESGFTGFPGGYRVENGTFLNQGSIGTWWSSTESNSRSAVDHYLSQTSSINRSSNPKQRGESVRCIKR